MDHEREFNPYRAPRSTSAPPRPAGPDGWADMPTSVPGHHGLLWLWRAARIVAARPGLWAMAVGLVAVVPYVPALILSTGADEDIHSPTVLLVGLYWVLWPVLTGGIVGAAHKQMQAETIRLRDIFAFFRSWLLFLAWSCVGFCVSLLMSMILAFVPGLLFPLLSRAMTAALRPHLPFVAFVVTAAIVVGNVFIAAAASLRGEWPLRVLFRAGLVNAPAFLLNLAVLAPLVWAVERLGGLIVSGQAAPPVLTRLWMTTEYALIWFGLALTAYAAVRDIFFVPEKATAQPAAAS